MLRPTDEDMIEVERLKFEVEILVKMAYKFRENCDVIHAVYLKTQFNTVAFIYNETFKKFYLD